MGGACVEQDENDGCEVKVDVEIVWERGKGYGSERFVGNMEDGGKTIVDVWDGVILGGTREDEEYVTGVDE